MAAEVGGVLGVSAGPPAKRCVRHPGLRGALNAGGSVVPRTRSAELRQQSRRILAWSLGAAAIVHVVVFALWPETPVEPLGEFPETVVSGVEEEGVFIQVRAEFAGPTIVSSGGRPASEGVARTLEARRLARVAVECRAAVAPGRSYRGEVRLTVNGEGRVDYKEMVAGSGDSCGDRVLLAIAGDLWYRWLPNEAHRAPVVVIQPLVVVGEEE